MLNQQGERGSRLSLHLYEENLPPEDGGSGQLSLILRKKKYDYISEFSQQYF